MQQEKRKARKRESGNIKKKWSAKARNGEAKTKRDSEFASFPGFRPWFPVFTISPFRSSYLPFAFRPMVVRIASSSPASASSGLILAGVPIPESLQISSQYAVSDASFSATPILWMKSSFDSALFASR
jgi:hypothetical protein